MVEFSSLNPYQNLEVIVADTPQDLVNQLKAIRRPIKIVSVVGFGTKQVAYIMGDIRKDEVKSKKLRG